MMTDKDAWLDGAILDDAMKNNACLDESQNTNAEYLKDPTEEEESLGSI